MESIIQLYAGKKSDGWMRLNVDSLPAFVERLHPDDNDLTLPSVYGTPMVEAREMRVQRFWRIGTTAGYKLEGT